MQPILDFSSSSEIFEDYLQSQPTLQRSQIHTIILQHHGETIWEYADPQCDFHAVHQLFSITKSVVSLGFGKYVERFGSEALHEPILKWCSDYGSESQEERLARLTIHHLLNQTSGFRWREMGAHWGSGNPLWEMEHQHDWISYVLKRGFSTEPGRHFNYSSGASHLLPFLLGRILKVDPAEFYLSEILFPLGIDHLQWDSDPLGNLVGGKGLALRPRDVIKLATPILRNDAWIHLCRENKVRVLPKYGDYGYQWWLKANNVVAAMGFGGQALLVDANRQLAMTLLGKLGKEHFFLPQELFLKFQERVETTD